MESDLRIEIRIHQRAADGVCRAYVFATRAERADDDRDGFPAEFHGKGLEDFTVRGNILERMMGAINSIAERVPPPGEGE